MLALLSLLITITFVACRQLPSNENSAILKLDNQDKVVEIVSKETGVLTIWWYEGYVPAEKNLF